MSAPNPLPVRLRRAGAADVGTIRLLATTALTAGLRDVLPPEQIGALLSGGFSLTAIAGLLAAPATQAWLAERLMPPQAGAPVGFVVAGPHIAAGADQAGEGELLTLGVVPAAQRRGVGARLWRAAAADQRARSRWALWCAVPEGAYAARAFVERQGAGFDHRGPSPFGLAVWYRLALADGGAQDGI